MADFMQDQILTAIKTQLIAAGTAAGSRVRIEGVDSRSVQAMPAIEIEAGDEQVSVLSNGMRSTGRSLQREFRVELHAVVSSAGSDYRAQAGALQQQIEHVMHASGVTLLDALVPDRVRLLGSRAGRDGDASRVVYVIRSMWEVRYQVKEGHA